MEHRSEPRRAMQLRVVVHAKGNKLIRGRLRDVSRHGMFVEADPSGVRRNGTLRIGFLVDEEFQVARARVARKTRSGIGLRVLGGQPAVEGALHRLLLEPSAGMDSAPPRQGAASY